MTQKEKDKIRNRDHYWYNKLHGAIPKGYTMHHNYYNELWYDEDAFIIITKEEHDWIHGYNIPASTGTDIMAYKKEYYANNREKMLNYSKEYYNANKEEILKRNAEYVENHKEKVKECQAKYHQLNKDKRNERSRNYRAKVKAVRMSNGLSRKEWDALTREDRKRLMDTFMENGGNMI